MAREWKVKCKDCEKEFGYSDWSYRIGAQRGQSRPERCPECRKRHNHETSTMGLAYFDLKPRKGADTANLNVGELGKLSHPPRPHGSIVQQSQIDAERHKFGLKDEDVELLFRWLGDPNHQVAVVVGPTGSGKSTALPYMLIEPPPAVVANGIAPDQFTRHGQVLVTQPRIQATRNIPAFVAEKLVGGNVGAGYDVGFRHSNNPYSDWRNRLVYATDGTLINWIVSGQIANLSVIMIDEAHERSLNIDVILGLLKKVLPRYPHLKLIIASATIDSDLFLDYFNNTRESDRPEDRRDTATLIEFQGKKQFEVQVHFAHAVPETGLPCQYLTELRREAPGAVADEVNQQLGQVKAGVVAPETLGFLQPEPFAEPAVGTIRQEVAQDPLLLGKIQAVDLSVPLPQSEQDHVSKKPDASR